MKSDMKRAQEILVLVIKKNNLNFILNSKKINIIVLLCFLTNQKKNILNIIKEF